MLLAVILFQLILGALIASLSTLVAYLVLRDDRWALLAGLITGLEPQGIFFSTLIYTETVFSFLLLISVLLLFQHVETKRFWSGFLLASAIVIGIAALCRPIAQYIALIAIPLALVLDRRFPVKQRILRSVLPFVALYAITVFPWVLRNYNTFGIFNLTDRESSQGIWLVARINVASANSSHEAQSEAVHEELERLATRYIAEFNQLHQTNIQFCKRPFLIDQEKLTAEYCRFISGKTRGVMTEHLGLYLKHSAQTFAQMLFAFNKDVLGRILDTAISPERVSTIAKNIISGRFDAAFRQLGSFTIVDYIGLAWSALFTLVLNLLAVGGFFWLLKEGNVVTAVLLVCLLGVLFAITSLAVAFGENMTRLRVPAVPYLAVLAVCTIKSFVQHYAKLPQQPQASS